jgi:hypothetical protein
MKGHKFCKRQSLILLAQGAKENYLRQCWQQTRTKKLGVLLVPTIKL